MNLKFSLFFCLLFLIISCETNESVEEEKLPSAEITSYTILDNNLDFVKTQTDIEFSDTQNQFLEEHGVYWYKNSGSKRKINLGTYQSNQFTTDISQGLLKDSIYKTFPFVKFQGNYIYGDTLIFKSLFTSMIKIEEVTPKKGFINDTISIKGKNFCAEDFRNGIRFGSFSQLNIISESDTLIKATVPTHLKESELFLSLISCNTTTQIDDKFTINAPIIDSISSGEKYIGDVLTIYGKNIHTSISEVWLDNIKAQLVYNNNSIDSVSIEIPKKLSVGKVALKMKVIDKEIEKLDYFETTSPYIDGLYPQKVGLLDTLTVKGNYFKQKNSSLKVYVGNSLQRIVGHKKDEIKIFINRSFYDTNPKVKLEFTDFTLEEPVQILPPTILGFNKEIYNLNETDFTIKTASFLDHSNIEIGERDKNFGVKSEIDINGNVNLSLNSWLNIDSYSWDYKLTTPGSLEVKIKTQFGEDSKLVKIHKPEIFSVNKTEFLADDHIILTGNNFAHRSFTKVYIDNEQVTFLANSAHTLKNDKIEFPLNLNTTAGIHKLHVVTAGQKSNEIEYSIKKTEIVSLNKNSGTRKDLYEIKGKNLNKIKIIADDYNVTEVTRDDELVTFKLPYFKKLESNFNISAYSGDQKFDLGNFNGIEPFDFFDKVYEDDVPYYKTHISFSDNENWYFCNNKGVYKFSFEKMKWEAFDSNPPPFGTPTFGEKAYISLENGIAKYPIGNLIYLYDTHTKVWSEFNLTNISVKNGVVLGNTLYGIKYNTNDFYKVDLTNNSIQKIEKPADLNIVYENITYGDEKIFINPFQGSGYYFDIKNNKWVNIGRPRNFYGTYNNVSLKYYNGNMFFSGGFTDGGVEHRLYQYNVSTNTWSEKTPMLQKLMNHVSFIKDDKMYFSLGIGQYYYTNPYVQVYDIINDPN